MSLKTPRTLAVIHHFLAAGAELSVCLLAAAVAGCGQENTPPRAAADAPTSLLLMTFNVENLFDTRHDPGKNDETYLPLAVKQSPGQRQAQQRKCHAIKVKKWRHECLYWDWNEAALKHKLKVVSAAILQANGGRGPDILVLQEVENRAVLERLRTEYLAAADYRPAILIEGWDVRGIDVAFLSRFDLAQKPTLHRIPFAGVAKARMADTRGILEATFRLPDGSLLTAFGVHFPAPFHPWQMRRTAYKTLNRLRSRLPPGRSAFAAGDFNTPTLEDRRRHLLDSYVRPHWTLARDSGCAGCRGTYYYAAKKTWSYLDMILWSGAASGTGAETETPTHSHWHLIPGATVVVNGTADQITAEGYPAAFELPDVAGASDHWPLATRIEKTE